MRKPILSLLLILLLTSCTTAFHRTPAPAQTPVQVYGSVGSWVRYTPFHWSHDGRPYESEHIRIFADRARDQDKVRFAEEGEKSLEFVQDVLGVADEEIRYPPRQGKIDIFASSTHQAEMGGGWAYYGGFLFTYDRSSFTYNSIYWPESFPYEPLFNHEMTHVVEYLVEGHGPDGEMLSETWFHEGVATYLAQDQTVRIDTHERLNILKRKLEQVPGGGNPTLISKWDEIPAQYFAGEMLDDLYCLFELAAGYLADTYGVEKFRLIFLDLRAGMSFEQAFADEYGMSLTEYQQSFFSLTEGYLP